MYLDPDPRGHKSSKSSRTRRDNSSGFFASQRPIASPRDRQSQQKASSTTALPIPPKTVRLVEPSPSPFASTEFLHRTRSIDTIGDSYSNSNRRNDRHRTEGDSNLTPLSSVVSHTSSLNDTPILDFGSNSTLSANEGSLLDLPKWYQRSISSGSNYSQSSTVKDRSIGVRKESGKGSDRSSFGTTLRGTPISWDAQSQDRGEVDVVVTPRSEPARVLQTLQEVSPEKPATVRGVPPSETSSSSATETRPNSASYVDDSDPRHQPADSSPVNWERVAESSPANWEEVNSPQSSWGRASSRTALSVGSVRLRPGISDLRAVAASVSSERSSQDLPRSDSSQISLGEREVSHPSSPNFVTFGPGSTHETIPEEAITSTSAESLERATQRRHSGSGPTLASTSSSASLGSNYVLPSLYIPRRRPHSFAPATQHIAEVEAPRAEDNMDNMEDDEIDTLPFPRRPFSSHLSTIASMSDHQHSPRTSQRPNSLTLSRMSYFSMGSGVLTGDDVSDRRSIPLSIPLSMPLTADRRRRSEPSESVASSLPEGYRAGSFDVPDSPERTRGSSAVPQPLFRAGQPTMLNTSKKHDGPMPPLPPIPTSPQSHDEDFDTLSALPSPALHAQKSGHSLRHQRSKSTPSSHSRQTSQVSSMASEVDSMSVQRNSTGSVIFPMWARRFYSGTHSLASKQSLSDVAGNQRREPPPRRHERNDSSWTDRSITSRLGTGYSNMESISPTSSHFMPAVFRARTRKLIKDGRINKTSKRRRSNGSDRGRERDSMTITALDDRPPPGHESSTEYLPSGQPKYGRLKESSPEPGKRRLPRKYSKQRLWNQMEFPRPMTSDRLSDFDASRDFHDPRLGPPTRASQQGLPRWYAPSFVESLDTLIKSRCNRQILFFTIGFVVPLAWMLGAVLPLPHRPVDPRDLPENASSSQVDVATAMMKHEAGADSELRWREERTYLKARWWRMLNRVMSAVGVLVIAAIVALVVITV